MSWKRTVGIRWSCHQSCVPGMSSQWYIVWGGERMSGLCGRRGSWCVRLCLLCMAAHDWWTDCVRKTEWFIFKAMSASCSSACPVVDGGFRNKFSCPWTLTQWFWAVRTTTRMCFSRTSRQLIKLLHRLEFGIHCLGLWVPEHAGVTDPQVMLKLSQKYLVFIFQLY